MNHLRWDQPTRLERGSLCSRSEVDSFRKPTRTTASHRTRHLPRYATLFSLAGTGTCEIVSLRARRRKEINTYTLLKKKICPFKMNQIFHTKKL
ncbi:hypothetical protein EVA_15927 [gut metagenome]|uniref:Uncharacterized protein n=1 Tax=gut metagenome TaxID=749906 RepID=J9FM23_9ZZZZ